MTAGEMDLIIGADVTQAIAALKKLGYTITQTEKAAGNFTAKTKTNFTGLNRVIQDLPFGFIAISNNLEQLLPAAGAAGLAISAITAAITFAQVGLSNWARGIKSATGDIDEFAKAGANVQTELTKMVALVNIGRDLTENTDTRKNAIQELQKEYPGYLGNLTLENIGSQETANAVRMLTDALQRKAKVQAVSNLLTKAEEGLIKAQNATIADNLLSIKSFFGALKGGLGGGAGAVSVIGAAAEQTADNISDAEKEVSQLSKTLTELTADQARNSDFSLLSPTTPKKLKEVASSFKDINANITGAKNTGIVHFANIIGNAQKELDIHPLQFKFEAFTGSESAKKAIADMEKLTEIIKSTLVSGLSAVGESLGNVLAGAKNPFAPIFAVLSEGLKTLGKAYIEIGIQALIAQKALKLLMASPYLTIAAGIAFVALGQLLQSKARNVKAFATGGVVTKPTLALVGEQGPERITPLGYEGQANNSWMGGEVVFQISGQNLRGILRRADQTAFNTF